MGVLVGDEKAANLPTFVVACGDEFFDRAKNKFYERFNLPLQMLQGKTEEIRRALFNPNAAEKTKVTDGRFLLDDGSFRNTFWNRLLLLDIKKAGAITHRLLGFLN